MVEVFTHTYNEIFKQYKNISVPEYQRPYSWTTEKVDELLMDLEEFFITKPNPNLEYYIGGILFYQDSKEKKSQITGHTNNLLYVKYGDPPINLAQVI